MSILYGITLFVMLLGVPLVIPMAGAACLWWVVLSFFVSTIVAFRIYERYE